MSNQYNIIRIQQYINGTLSREEMYQLEREAADDPFLNDAIEGYSQQHTIDHGRLSLLQQRLATRIETKQQERHTFFYGWQRLGVAATACVLMILVLTLLWMRNHVDVQRDTAREVEVQLSTPGMVAGIHAEPIAGEGLDALPIGGWDVFNDYLSEKRDQFSGIRQLDVTFTIDSEGRPTGIRTTGNISASQLGELQQLLRDGPRWQGTEGSITIRATEPR